LPDRRLRARDGHGFRGAQAVRPAPDHRGHAGRGRDHAGAADGAASVEDLRGHGGGLPGRHHAPVCEPDGDQHLGHRGEVPAHPAGGPVPFGAGHGLGAGAGPRDSRGGDPLPGGGHQPHVLLPEFRAPAAGRILAGPVSRAEARLCRGALPQALPLERALPEQGALRDDAAAGLFCDRVVRALRRVRAVVHQARPARPDRALRHPPRRVPEALRGADRALGDRGEGAARGGGHRGEAVARIRVLHRELGGDGRAVGHLRKRAERGPYSAAARGMRGGGAGAGGQQRAPAHAGFGDPAAADRAYADQRERAGPDGAGPYDREPGAHLPRRDARPPCGGGAGPRPDLGPCGRPAGSAWGVHSGLGPSGATPPGII
ncbi:MAG: GH4, partial [uncultured Rubellimicrobium sp.]